jgi:uncharacterized protein (DUF2141 family)
MRHRGSALGRIGGLAIWAAAAGWFAVLTAGCTKPHPTTPPAGRATVPTTVGAGAASAANHAPRASNPATGRYLARLAVRVTGLRNQKGQLIFGVFTSADGFPNVEGKSVNWQVKDAAAEPVTFHADLPPGVYGASVLHDENRNGRMERNLAGIPQEGYGVTNNPKPALRAATFGEATFTLPPEGKAMTISLQYFQ